MEEGAFFGCARSSPLAGRVLRCDHHFFLG